MSETKIDKFLIDFDKKSLEGYSVYDAFNSTFLKQIGKLEIKLINVIITQAFKRIPFNIRGLFGVKKSINPKALGLILKAKLKFSKTEAEVISLYQLILSQKNKEFKNLSWGYNWDYYTLRGGTFPKGFPNAIVTYFIGDALIDYYKKYPSEELKVNLLSIRDYFLEDINQTERLGGICFSYSSVDNKEIYNASALISRYLYRLDKIFTTNDRAIIIKSTNYLKNVQNDDGSWYYGNAVNQRWVDSFHTEYLLEFFECLDNAFIEEMDLTKLLSSAQDYYLKEFYFDKVCNYYPKKKYPINVHSIASRIIYLSKHKKLNEAKEIIDWSFNYLYNTKNHSFYFEKNKYYTNRNLYHRWNQSWMYLALSSYKNVSIDED
ncbi:hypothetical protein [Winogradskyella forsetii]|uniref:hypothetical protein n=1 Tax=Winogradskyella forsetii TaxID=2686077 RepID=UPI0015B96794|nr:hypothetical protein [Winogradskyella forsetii]